MELRVVILHATRIPLPKEIRGQGRDPILELEVILVLESGSGV